MKNARIEFSTHWPLLALHRAARTTATDAPAVTVPIHVDRVSAEPCTHSTERSGQVEVPPSAIERPLHFPEGREDPELEEYLKPPALPWERPGG